MSFTNTIPNHLKPRREKLFGDGRPMPLDRNAKARVMARARGLMRRTEKGKHYGPVTAKALAVLEVLLWGFHNARSGLCFPSYEAIAEKAGCARSTVAEAISALERAGLLTWVNRIVRIRERCDDLFGRMGSRWRIIRTSNGYRFIDPKGLACWPGRNSLGFSSKSDFPSGTSIQDSILPISPTPAPALNADTPLGAALLRFGKTIGALKGA
jgi:hypothetical protein